MTLNASVAISFTRFLFKNFVKDGCLGTAAALTYQTLFAVVPLLTVTYAVLASFSAFPGIGENIESFVFNNIVPENVSVVQGYLRSFSDQARRLSLPSLILLAVTAFLMMYTIERTFNEIWLVQEPRQGFQRVLVYWAVLTIGPFLLVITTYVFSLPLISDVAQTPIVIRLLPSLASAIMFTLMYVAIPNCLVPIRHAVLGGIVVAIIFELAQRLFVTVMSRSDFEVIYGTFAAVPLFLLWIYLSWTIVLFGAEFVKGLGLYRFGGSGKLESPLTQMLIILEVFFRCHQKGHVVTEDKIKALGQRINMEAWHEYKHRMVAMGLIRGVDRGGLVLSKDLNEVSIWDLHQELPWQLPAGFVNSSDTWEAEVTGSLSEVFEFSQRTLHMDLEQLFRGTTSHEELP